MGYDPKQHRDGKRNRERKSKRILTRWEWHHKGRAVVVVEMTSQGVPLITVTVPKWRVDEASREAAAWWLNQLQPRLTHDEAFEILWGK